jgi:hypothetical protein
VCCGLLVFDLHESSGSYLSRVVSRLGARFPIKVLGLMG